VRVDLPNIETIEECMFMDCESLKGITIPNSITKIKRWAFSRCTSLENIVIAEQVYQIGRNVFEGCTSLDNVHVPSNITKMEQSVFEQCTSLTRVKFDAKIITLPKQTFLDCSALECVDFTGADTIKRMRESCFQNCIHLRTIVLPPNLGFIEDSSFKACIGLEHISIHKNVRSIGTFGFFGCTNLRSLILHDGIKTIGNSTYANCTSLGKVVIPASVGDVNPLCFQNCIKLEEVLFNEGCKVNEIHTGTFENCMKLETINLWCRVNNIHKDAFKNCFSLQEFNGSYVSYFHDYAFTNCTNLREVKLDIGNVLKISCDTFSGCICQMLKLTFDDDMEALLSQLPHNPVYWLRYPDVMDSMLKIGKFLAKENMPRRLITMKTRIWGCYRKRILFHINEMCKHAMKPYVHMSIDEEMYCADNILVAHYNMNQVIIYLTLTIGNVHNISIKSAQFNSSDTVAMGVAANLGAKHEKTPQEE
jgi:hypothetical protein